MAGCVPASRLLSCIHPKGLELSWIREPGLSFCSDWSLATYRTRTKYYSGMFRWLQERRAEEKQKERRRGREGRPQAVTSSISFLLFLQVSIAVAQATVHMQGRKRIILHQRHLGKKTPSSACLRSTSLLMSEAYIHIPGGLLFLHSKKNRNVQYIKRDSFSAIKK